MSILLDALNLRKLSLAWWEAQLLEELPPKHNLQTRVSNRM
jgi:hypothetical protein